MSGKRESKLSDERRIKIISGQKGVILVTTFIIMILLTAIAAAFLYMNSVQTLNIGYDIPDSQAVWLAEAGLQKAIWNLKTPTGSGGQGEDWTTSGTAENLGAGSYNMVVARWDFCLATNGSSASASSALAGNPASSAIDGNDTTYWESATKPTPDEPDKPPQEIIITFPYPLAINKVRFLVPSGSSQQAPKDYTWEVSSDGITYTIVVSVQNSSAMSVTNTFSAVSNVNFLKLRVTKINGGSIGVRIATLEAIGSKINSTGTVNTLTRQVQQTVVADDATQTASNEIDWTEV